MKEKLIDILENEKEDELIPFLQSLTLKDKKALSTTIKSKAKELIEDVQKPDIGWTSVGAENQITLLSVVIFVCLGITDFTKLTTHRWAPKSNIINVRKETILGKI